MKHVLAACPNTLNSCNAKVAVHGWTPGGAIFGIIIVGIVFGLGMLLVRRGKKSS